MFIELQATYFVLKRWKQDCVATRKQIGIWSEWKQETEDNDRPLSKDEAERMKAFLRRSAQTSYFELFVEERADW